MRALRFHTARDLRIEDVAEPAEPGTDDVVVRVAACGICGTDLHEFVAGPIVTPVEPHPLTGAQNPQILEQSQDMPTNTRLRAPQRVWWLLITAGVAEETLKIIGGRMPSGSSALIFCRPFATSVAAESSPLLY